MSLVDILVILGCLAGGYWIVSSVMGPGVDITRRDPPASGDAPPSPAPAPTQRRLPHARREDWSLLLDVSSTATRVEIEAAYKRQLDKALAAGDSQLQERLRLARDAALAESRRNAFSN